MKYNEAYQALVLAYRDGNKLPIELIKEGYNDLIEYRKAHPVLPKDYDVSQDHHIVPLAENGPDVPENIVKVLYSEHLIAHAFLWEIYHDDDMYDAMLLLSKGKYPGELWSLNLVKLNGKYKLSRKLSRKRQSNRVLSRKERIRKIALEKAVKIQETIKSDIYSHDDTPDCTPLPNYDILPEYMPRPKKIYCFTLDGKFKKVWSSIEDIRETLEIDGMSIQRIRRCLHGESPSAMWMLWRYEEDVEYKDGKYTMKTQPRNKRIIFQYTKTGKFVKAWPNASIAASVTGCDYTTIRRCCDNKEKSCGGFLWAYRETALSGHIPVFCRNEHIEGSSIAQIDPKTNKVIRYWCSLGEIEEELSIKSGHISQCCYGTKKTVRGFIWRYVKPGEEYSDTTTL